MMRGVRTWAVAVRKPRCRGRRPRALGPIAVESFPLRPWAARRRVCRWPVIRGVVALAESLTIGIRALGISANAQLPASEEPQQLSGGVWAGTIVVSLAFAIGLFFVVPVGLTSLIKHQLGSSFLFWLVEGLLRTAIFLGYLLLLVASEGPAARVRIPRRRAQGDLVLRSRGRARTVARGALLAVSPPLRNELPARGDDRGDLRFRPDRAAGLVDPRAHADPRSPADRGDLVRGDQMGGA